MKKPILLSFAVLGALSALSQAPERRNHSLSADMTREWDARWALLNKVSESSYAGHNATAAEPGLQAMKRSAPLSSIAWNPISASMNVFGVLVSSTKPLQYNNELNAVSFIHRKSPSYQPNPMPQQVGAQTGAIVGMVTTNWGNTWDSTCVWNDENNWARYPSGAISNPVLSNTLVSGAYLVAAGPITQANTSLGWTGNFFASKSLSAFDNVASTAPGAQQFITSEAATGGPNGPTYGPTGKVDFARIDLTATDDGKVRVMGGIFKDPDGNTAATQGFRGPRILTGSFNSGVYTWTGDSLPINVTADSQDGSLNWFGGRCNMAWNDAGTIGYAWYYGSRTGATGNNIGFQPVVFKSTNGGAWTAINSIDFNDKVKFKAPVLDHLFPAVLDTASIIPFFNFREGFDGTVDANGQLHIMATLWSSSKSHPDSVGFAYTNFTNWDGETYSYVHGSTSLDELFQTTGIDATKRMNRPYIYDFYTLSNGTWSVVVVDSMPSEAPGETSTADGFDDNPWDINPDGGAKVGSDARFQMSRTPGGSKIIYTWAESDTNYTNQGRKWNHVNNVKARLLDVNAAMGKSPYWVYPEEFNLTNPSPAPVNPYVKDRAQMHNTSPKCAYSSNSSDSYTITLPVKVTNNQNTPMQQLTPNVHWYTSAALEFTVNTIGINEAEKNQLKTSLYPNPSAGISQLAVELDQSSKINVSIYNQLGQMVKEISAVGRAGKNEIAIHTDGFPAGMYIVQVKAGQFTGTRKLILE